MTESKAGRAVVLDAESKQQLSDASLRLARAEQELTLAMSALIIPEQGADNVMIGERVRVALFELGTAQRALAVVVAAAR